MMPIPLRSSPVSCAIAPTWAGKLAPSAPSSASELGLAWDRTQSPVSSWPRLVWICASKSRWVWSWRSAIGPFSPTSHPQPPSSPLPALRRAAPLTSDRFSPACCNVERAGRWFAGGHVARASASAWRREQPERRAPGARRRRAMGAVAASEHTPRPRSVSQRRRGALPIGGWVGWVPLRCRGRRAASGRRRAWPCGCRRAR